MSYFPLSGHRNLLVFPRSSSPTGAEHMRSSSSSMDNPNFDSDVVVVTVALLCALISGIGLTLFISCALRGSRRTVLDASDEVPIQVVNSRLKEAMKALPVVVYADTSKPPGVDTDCPICLAKFSEGEKVRVLPTCYHSFHLECIDEWLVSCYSCPVCRHCPNLHIDKPEGAAIAEATESDNAMHRVVESTDSTEAISARN